MQNDNDRDIASDHAPEPPDKARAARRPKGIISMTGDHESDSADRTEAGPCRVDVTSEPPRWDEYLLRHPEATIFHDPRWGQVMTQAYANRPYYLTARQGNTVVGVLQLVRQKSMLFGARFCSVPYLDAAGILADGQSIGRAMIDKAEALRRELRLAWVELRQTEPLDMDLPVRTDKVTMRLPLSPDPDALWKQFKAKVRNQVRKAERAELAGGRGGRELLGEFYGVYLRNMRDLGSPPHSKRFFEVRLEHFEESVRLFVVRQADTAVAASVTLTDRHGLHVPWAGSDWRVRELCPNMLLYWTMLQHACQDGAAAFDFGRSTREGGTYRFKKQWGAQEVPLHWHYLLPEGQSVPEFRPDSRKYRLMVACWKRLPLRVAKVLGPRIIRSLS